MDNIAYATYISQRNSADTLYETLRELYGAKLTDSQLRIKARRDRVISEGEYSMLTRFEHA